MMMVVVVKVVLVVVVVGCDFYLGIEEDPSFSLVMVRHHHEGRAGPEDPECQEK